MSNCLVQQSRFWFVFGAAKMNKEYYQRDAQRNLPAGWQGFSEANSLTLHLSLSQKDKKRVKKNCFKTKEIERKTRMIIHSGYLFCSKKDRFGKKSLN